MLTLRFSNNGSKNYNMNENLEQICKRCAYWDSQTNNENSACSICPVSTQQFNGNDDCFQRPQIISDESYIERNIKLLLFIERIAETFKNKQTLEVLRIYLAEPKLSATAVSKRIGLSRQAVYHHINKIKRDLPEIFETIEHKPKRRRKSNFRLQQKSL